jgi:predicted CXXCH cytochrome family protein
MAVSMDAAVRTVHRPERANCLQCHAKGGGGDAYKRGDLALAHAATGDRGFDVHMARTGANLTCQSCHDFTGHRVKGQGADLYPTDMAGRVTCSTSSCHEAIHGTGDLNRHLARVACQTCHIGTYARNAADTTATEATETHRSWAQGHLLPTGVFHPEGRFANDLAPEYRFWNGSIQGYSLHDQATFDEARGTYPITRPLGTVDDPEAKLYPFKYKTAEQPYITRTNQLLALNTALFFAQGQLDPAARSGLSNMGFPEEEPYTLVMTDTFQTLNHEVMPKSRALDCTACHGSAARMNLKAMGYALKNSMSRVCTQCHDSKAKGTPDFYRIHARHVGTEKLDCSACHTFSRPERNLRTGIVRH